MTRETSIHKKVLTSLTDIEPFEVKGKVYQFKIEEAHGRLDLPRENIFSYNKKPGQRKLSLLYTDAVLHDTDKNPRMLVEIVDSSPKNPNGIVGLTINVDRIAEESYPGIDLLFIVLSEMKQFWCESCERGHKIASEIGITCFERDRSCKGTVLSTGILHEGLAMNYRKALADYPIRPYLHNIQPPVVLFLNKEMVKNSWEEYRRRAHTLIINTIIKMLQTHNRENTYFEGMEELLS